MDEQKASDQESEEDVEPKYHFEKGSSGWYFKNERGLELGPFTEIVETVVGHWRTMERVLGEESMDLFLAGMNRSKNPS